MVSERCRSEEHMLRAYRPSHQEEVLQVISSLCWRDLSPSLSVCLLVRFWASVTRRTPPGISSSALHNSATNLSWAQTSETSLFVSYGPLLFTHHVSNTISPFPPGNGTQKPHVAHQTRPGPAENWFKLQLGHH